MYILIWTITELFYSYFIHKSFDNSIQYKQIFVFVHTVYSQVVVVKKQDMHPTLY